MDDFWVFGYGSLMWNPGFPYAERRLARAHGYRRALCVRSWVHRGTQDSPGLVLGLDYGGSCLGAAFRIAPADRDTVVDYLRERELVTHVYKERTLPVVLAGGDRATALSYVIDRSHVQYAGALDVEEAARIVAEAVGRSGANVDYVLNTVTHMREIGIRDRWLEEVAMLAGRLSGRAS